MRREAFSGALGFDREAVRAIIFDLDGTLVDSYEAIALALNHARTSLGREALPLEQVRRHVGRGLESLIAELCGAEHVARGVALFRARYEQVFSEHTRALPGVSPTLGELARRGYRLGVASNKPARFSEPILAQLALLPHLRCVAGPDTVDSTKPDPAMLRSCLKELGASEREALYVGDMALDAESGRRAAVSVVLVRGGSSSDADLDRTGLPVLDALSDLCDLLPERPGQV